MIPRRIFIASSISAVFATVLQGQDKKETKPAADAKTAKPAAKAEKTEKVVKTDEEWKKLLTPEQYEVTRKHGTERAFKNAYNDNKKKGVYNCVGCGQALYSSEHKFDSGTGWPSFYQPVSKSAIGTTEDKKLFYTRVEVHCSKCDAHLGHVFDDADGTASVPKTPTGLRYCMNSAAMKFVEKK
jgi:peptide-methionine (R)-S-oxide reductase